MAERDHPRAGGEHLAIGASMMHERGSSPRGRGALPRRSHGCSGPGIIPARAGSTTCAIRRRP